MVVKTNKSYTKRIKVSKNGTLSVRKKGQNHFNAKTSGQKRIGKRGSINLIMKNKDISRFRIK